jgi:hypothetical protein
MKCFRSFGAYAGPVERSERKALLIAFLCCLLFIAFVASIRRPMAPARRYVASTETVSPSHKNFYVEEPTVRDLRGQPTNVPENFELVDFGNRPYGTYKFSDGKVINLTLNDGEYHIVDEAHSGWFSLKNVYYTDVTGDGRDEAIVELSHVFCGKACDTNSHLFYIYTGRNGNLKNLWQYETGTNVTECGLKSLTVDGLQIVMELFGRCPKQATEYPALRNGMVQDLTFLLFGFDGRRFVQQQIDFYPSASKYVKDYEPQIRIYGPPEPQRGRHIIGPSRV